MLLMALPGLDETQGSRATASRSEARNYAARDAAKRHAWCVSSFEGGGEAPAVWTGPGGCGASQRGSWCQGASLLWMAASLAGNKERYLLCDDTQRY